MIKLIIIIPIALLFSVALVLGANASAATGKQVLISNNIQTIDSFGKYNDTEYTNFYNVRNLFDNATNSWSFYSNLGPSGFIVLVQNPIDKPICSVELDVYNPKNTPFNFNIGNPSTSANINGVLDNSKEIINIDNCINDVKTISMKFDPPKTLPAKDKWITLAEMKLFSNATTGPGPVEPPICKDGYHYDPIKKICVIDIPTHTNVTSITITNSTAFMNVTDSKIVLNINEDSTVIHNNAQLEEMEEDNKNDDDDDKEDDEN